MSDRAWIEAVAQHCEWREIAQCLNDLLDRAEFAEWMAQRMIVERLFNAIERMPRGAVTPELEALLHMVDQERLRKTAAFTLRVPSGPAPFAPKRSSEQSANATASAPLGEKAGR